MVAEPFIAIPSFKWVNPTISWTGTPHCYIPPKRRAGDWCGAAWGDIDVTPLCSDV